MPLRLMGVFAHPDDESLGNGGLFARYAAEGVELSLVTATRGQRGWPDETTYPGPDRLGEIREAELRSAAHTLGFISVDVLDYMDGELDDADPLLVLADLVPIIRARRPQVVVTFAMDGGYGHTDHVAISQLTTAAVVAAANPQWTAPDGRQPGRPHAVAKLYYAAWTQRTLDAYVDVFGEISMTFDGVPRAATPWPEWSISARIDTSAYQDANWKAILCHQSQLQTYARLGEVTPAQRAAIWGEQTYYRVFSTVNGTRRVETDLFEGLR